MMIYVATLIIEVNGLAKLLIRPLEIPPLLVLIIVIVFPMFNLYSVTLRCHSWTMTAGPHMPSFAGI